MARALVAAADHVSIATAPSGFPLTIACWVKYTGGSPSIFKVYSDANNYSGAYRNGSNGVTLEVWNGTDYPTVANASGTFGSGWHHVAASFNATDRVVYFDGSGTTDSTESVSPSGSYTKTTFGRNESEAAGITGEVAEVAVWSAILSPAEIAALYRGAPTYLIRPASLAVYTPVWGVDDPEPDWAGTGLTWSLGSTTAAAHHPPIAHLGTWI